jgi:hypothetical protein
MVERARPHLHRGQVSAAPPMIAIRGPSPQAQHVSATTGRTTWTSWPSSWPP